MQKEIKDVFMLKAKLDAMLSAAAALSSLNHAVLQRARLVEHRLNTFTTNKGMLRSVKSNLMEIVRDIEKQPLAAAASAKPKTGTAAVMDLQPNFNRKLRRRRDEVPVSLSNNVSSLHIQQKRAIADLDHVRTLILNKRAAANAVVATAAITVAADAADSLLVSTTDSSSNNMTPPPPPNSSSSSSSLQQWIQSNLPYPLSSVILTSMRNCNMNMSTTSLSEFHVVLKSEELTNSLLLSATTDWVKPMYRMLIYNAVDVAVAAKHQW